MTTQATTQTITPATTTTTPGAPIKLPTREDFAAGLVNVAGLERALATDASLRGLGLAFTDPTFYPFGFKLAESGVDRFRQIRLEHEERLGPDATLSAVERAYSEERRQDIATKLHELVMTEAGRLTRGSGTLTISKYALGQLLARAGAPGSAGAYLANCPVSMRAEHTNYWLGRAMEVATRRDGTHAAVSLEATLRTRVEPVMILGPDGKPATSMRRGIYACVGKGYLRGGAFAYPQAVRAFLGACPRDARCTFTSDGRRWRLSVSWMDPRLIPSDVVVGDTFRVGLWLESTDDASAGLMVGLDAERVRCLNCTTLYTRKIEGTLRHGQRSIAEKVVQVAQQALSKLSPFADAWRAARVDEVASRAYEDGVGHVFNYLVDEGLVSVPGVSDSEMVSRLHRAWQQEPGYSRADILNAVTRAAHSECWGGAFDGAQLEAQAGQLLYNFRLDSVPAPATQGTVDKRDLLETN